MTDRPFVHLHCHTHFSLLDGASRIPELVQHVKGLGMNAVAITDHGNLYGAVEFYRECTAGGLNPVIGYEAYVAPGKRTDREAKRRGEAGFHLTLLAKDNTGFQNLIKMSSIAFTEGYHYVPRIDKQLLEAHSQGLICLSGCLSGEFSEFLMKEQLGEAQKLLAWFHRVFGKNFYVEIQNNGLALQQEVAVKATDLANKMGLPLVATSDAHYLHQPDWVAHDILLCINTGKTRKDANRMKYDGNQFHVRGPKEMYPLFPGQEEAVKRSQEIADGVAIKLDFKSRHFPVFTPPDKKKPEDYLRELCAAGLKERYRGNPTQQAWDRLNHELGIICRMGFAGYFLIVWDFVRFALDSGIPCTARGSACGALVSFALRLSNVNPLDYDLLFERFLDPNRAEAPDIDIDFCQNRREEVIDYVKRKYGAESVAQIATFGTLAAKAAIKDVGRVLDVPLDRVLKLTALIPRTLGITLDEALEQVPDLRKEYETDPAIHELLDIARKLEGTNRNAGTHAAGVVVANGPIINFVPVHRVIRKGEDGDGQPVLTTQWPKDDIDRMGLLKIDMLGLRTLTMLTHCVRLIEETRGEKLDIYNLPLDDLETYKLLQRGDGRGVFQLEGEGIRELLKRMRPDNIRDLVAILALYRPGPLEGGMVDTYVNCKHGREQPTYAHPVMEEVLSETYGVMVYQEALMRILNKLGGIELSSAYACIKAISKKKQEIIDQRHTEFVKGASERGVPRETAEDIFALINKFGSYGFNKCLAGSTVIVDARTGERASIEDLIRRRRSFSIHALGDDGKLVIRSVTDVVWNGQKPVFELRTRQGKAIRATANHPFRVFDGWKVLDELKPGDRIAAPRTLPISAPGIWPTHEIITLAGLLSEGNTCHPTCLYFFNDDTSLVQDFADAVAQFPNSVARLATRRNRRWEVCVSTGQVSRFQKGDVPWNARNQPNVATVERPTRSGAYLWAARLEILGKKATEKFVPRDVFHLCDEALALFLGRLWAGDGFVGTHNQTPYYATSSRQLAEDVQLLLLRLGIISGVHEKVFQYRYKGLTRSRTGYTVHLVGEGSISTYVSRVLPHALSREPQVEAYRTHLHLHPRQSSAVDTLPREVAALVEDERVKAGVSWDTLEHTTTVHGSEFRGRRPTVRRGYARETIRQLSAALNSSILAQVATSDVFWDEVVSITPAGVEDTYDLTVESDHNFVANGLIVHNSHTAAYAQVGYQTAYLKTHYTPEFMAALLTSEIEDGNKRDIMVEHFDDAKRLGCPVQPPSVNTDLPDFTVRNGKLLFGLVAIKGLGRGAANEIVRARTDKGPFKDIFDLCERIDLKIVTKAALERLVKSGALDCFGAKRAQLWHVLPRALQAAQDMQNDRRMGQMNLFEVADGSGNGDGQNGYHEALPQMEEWPPVEKLKYEKEVLDFYVSSHPLAQVGDTISRFATHTVKDLTAVPPGTQVLLGGMLTGIRFMPYKKPNRSGQSHFVRCKVEDFSGSAESVLWGDELGVCKPLVVEDQPCFVEATVEKKTQDPSLVITRLLTVDQVQRERTTGLVLGLTLAEHGPQHIEQVGRILKRTPGSVPVFLSIADRQGKRILLKAGQEFNINPGTVNKAELETVLGQGRVHFSRQGNR